MKIKKGWVNVFAQFAIPILTISAQAVTALKYPEWGLIINMLAQPFWLYSSWKAYKEAKQVGIFITTIVLTVVIGLGILNYWFKF
jgi:hypothetical protein